MTTTAPPTGRTSGTTTIDSLLDAICGGAGVPARLLAPDAVLDATVPGWRFSAAGADALASQYGDWFDHPGTFEELERLAIDGGEVVTYLLTWVEGGVPHAAHHCHVLRLDRQGRITSDRFFCGGRWGASDLAEMAAAERERDNAR